MQNNEINGKNNPMVSIIIPIYNQEKYLPYCLDSVLAQTYTNIEIICVDDGSTDSSGAICDSYAAYDSRVYVLHIPNGGVSNARNTGLEAVRGEYIMFVDSDDWVSPSYVQDLLPVADEDMVYAGFQRVVGDVVQEKQTLPKCMITCEQLRSNFTGIWGPYPILSSCCSCYRSDIVKQNNIRYDIDIGMSEDELFNLVYLRYCSRIRFSDSCCYYYRIQTSGSQMTRYHSSRLEICIQTSKAAEELTGKSEYDLRWWKWHCTIEHYEKWYHRSKAKNRRAIRKRIYESYANPYFRQCIPYIREHGTLDQKIETCFMRRWLYPFFQPFYKCIIFAYKVKTRCK